MRGRPAPGLPPAYTMPTVLVVDDERQIATIARDYLTRAGFSVEVAADGATGLEVARQKHPDLVVLDLGLPRLSGLDVARALRRESDVPIIMLTARVDESDRLRGFEIGADDYITKPFSPRELIARVRAVLRRAHGDDAPPPHEIFDRGRLRIDFDTYEVAVEGQPVTLSLREFELLKFFVRHPNRVYDRLQLLDLVWGRDTYVEPRTVDVHIRRLRKRIERDDAAPELILTVRGVGYKCNPDALEA